MFYSKKVKKDKIIYKVCGIKFTRKIAVPAENKIVVNEIFANVSLMLNNLKYEIVDEVKKEKYLFPKVESRDVLLEKLIGGSYSLSRLGDGEFMLMTGGEINFQSNNEKLKQRLIEVAASNDDCVLVGISNIFGCLDEYRDDSVQGFRMWLGGVREKIYALLDFEKIYYDALISRPYFIYKNPGDVGAFFKKFMQIWDDKNIIFVEGAGSRLGVGNDLFSHAKSIGRILCPCENAFDKYDEIFAACKKQGKDKLFILALGPTASVLAYDLAKAGYRALDLGHIDIEYEWFLRKVPNKVNIENKYVGEVRGGNIVDDAKNEDYLKQIIVKIN